MLNIKRNISGKIYKKLKPGKVLILLGPRRVGKTFILNDIVNNLNEEYIFWNGEDIAVHEILER